MGMHHYTGTDSVSTATLYDNSTHSISQPVISQASHILWLQMFSLLQWLHSCLYIKIMLKDNIKTFKSI
jgi:hypothetical protein